MSKKMVLSIFLIFLGVSTGLLVIFAYSMSGGKPAIALPILGSAILCVITGTILAFSRLLDRSVSPFLEEIHKDIEDDIQDIKEHRITNPTLMTLITGVAAFTFAFFVFRFHKLEAMWGSVPVAIPTLVAIVLVAWFIPRTNWFQSFADDTPMWVFLIPTAGLIISMVIGITKTENMSLLRASPQEPVEYNTYEDTGYFLQSVGSAGNWGLTLDVPSCDDEICGVLLIIALVILTLVLIIGSAFIPHFWLLSGSILLGIMALITIHDLRIRPKYWKKSLKSHPSA